MHQAIIRNAVILGLFAIATAAMLAWTNDRTRDRVACNRQFALEESLLAVMPATHADNSLLEDRITVTDSRLGRSRYSLYRARLDGAPSGAVLEAAAPDGYGGNIAMLIGVDYDGVITGVRIVPPHNETPGLGDKIETRKSDWILSFDGRSLADTPPKDWAVRQDGGDFDSFTGATITPRAVVGAVYRALDFYQAQRDSLFAAESEAAPDMSGCGSRS
ncbi:electron transport complex subunit RsxG [Alcanivorax limicola]|uniref:electron transport complex subunit RsxG n=1 Tax=Alcanivorax limicola TaxID=2874102 RepID=UPI001CBDAAC0|nr:electron transport complex subunit RsxG [Alcanivorax limicola]